MVSLLRVGVNGTIGTHCSVKLNSLPAQALARERLEPKLADRLRFKLGQAWQGNTQSQSYIALTLATMLAAVMPKCS